MCVYWVVTVLCKRTRGAHEGKRPEARGRAGREAPAAGGTAPGRSSASAGAQAGGQRGGKRSVAVSGCAPVRRLPACQPALRPAACGERRACGPVVFPGGRPRGAAFHPGHAGSVRLSQQGDVPVRPRRAAQGRARQARRRQAPQPPCLPAARHPVWHVRRRHAPHHRHGGVPDRERPGQAGYPCGAQPYVEVRHPALRRGPRHRLHASRRGARGPHHRRGAGHAGHQRPAVPRREELLPRAGAPLPVHHHGGAEHQRASDQRGARPA